MAIENLRFEIYFRFSRIQTQNFFTFYADSWLNTNFELLVLDFQ